MLGVADGDGLGVAVALLVGVGVLVFDGVGVHGGLSSSAKARTSSCSVITNSLFPDT